MDIHQNLSLLGGLSPAQFMRRYWQKKPLLIKQAVPNFEPPLRRAELFALAAQEHVESRLVVQSAAGWRMKHGPFGPRALPALSKPGWSLLVQGVDLHQQQAHALLQQFRFVPDARLDDLMVSFASTGGGVGPHFDSYDVFLLQASGRRRWRISPQKDLALHDDLPLKILRNFEPTQEFVLDAGDMLYLPPRYAHDGVALASEVTDDGCMTYSIGFKAPQKWELASAILQRLADHTSDQANYQGDAADLQKNLLYRDADQPATRKPAAVPKSLQSFAKKAVQKALKDPRALPCALGEYLTEPKPSVWFEQPPKAWRLQPHTVVQLDPRSRMMYDADHVFMNGEAYLAKGKDATLMQRLADQRRLDAADWRKASPDALDLLKTWHAAGWILTATAEKTGKADAATGKP